MWNFVNGDKSIDGSEENWDDLYLDEGAANRFICDLIWTNYRFMSVMEYGSRREEKTPENEVSTNVGHNGEQLIFRIHLVSGVFLKKVSITFHSVFLPVCDSLVFLWRKVQVLPIKLLCSENSSAGMNLCENVKTSLNEKRNDQEEDEELEEISTDGTR